MNEKNGYRLRGETLEALFFFVRILVVLTIITTPLCMITLTSARYAASGAGEASARVAKWHNWIAPTYGNTGNKMNFRPRMVNDGIAIRSPYRTNDDTFTDAFTALWQEFSVHNDSEVAVKYTMFVLYAQDKDYNFNNVTNPLEGQKSDAVCFAPFTPVGNYLGGHMNGFYNTTDCVLPAVTDNGNNTWTSDAVAPGKTAWFQVFFYESSIENGPIFNGYLTQARKGSVASDDTHQDIAKGQKCKLYILAEQAD